MDPRVIADMKEKGARKSKLAELMTQAERDRLHDRYMQLVKSGGFKNFIVQCPEGTYVFPIEMAPKILEMKKKTMHVLSRCDIQGCAETQSIKVTNVVDVDLNSMD